MATASLLSIGLAIALFLVYLLYRDILHPTFISPLSKLPAAHPTSHFSSRWIERRRRSGRESRSIFSAHRHSGPVVRLGPAEVSVCSREALRTVYFSGWGRSKWVLAFRNYHGTPNLITMLDRRQHAIRKRILSNLFSKSYLLGSADFSGLCHAIVFGRLLPLLDEAAMKGFGVDVFEISRALAVEMMSAYQVGIQNGLDLTSPGRDAARKRHVENGKVKLRELNGCKQAAKELEDECFQMALKADKSLRSASNSEKVYDGSNPPIQTHPVVFAQLSSSIPSKEGVIDQAATLRLAASEMLDNLEAARVGIGITLTYALYRLSQRPDLQSKLRDELMALPAPPSRYLSDGVLSSSTVRQIDGIALLNAIVIETLRVHSSAPGPQFRTVPDGGAVIDGYFIPAGTSISASIYCLHQQFPDPDAWRPERWMAGRKGGAEQPGESGERANEAQEEEDPRRWFWAFGKGGWMCIGSNFALVATKVILASVYASFTSTVTNDDGAQQRDELAADPVADKLILGFHNVKTRS